MSKGILKRINYLDVFTASIILITPLINFLIFVNYSILTPETLSIFTGYLLMSFVIFAGISQTSYRLRSILFSLIITASFDLSFIDLHNFELPFQPQILMGFLILLFVILMYGLLVKLQKSINLLLIIVFSAMNITSIAAPLLEKTAAESEKPLDTSQPNIIHLYLDEHIGIEGFPNDIFNSLEQADEVRDFYLNNSFHVYGGAYSTYLRSAFSMTSMLNYSNSPENLSSYMFEPLNKRSFSIKTNKYFKQLSEQGYNIHVYQSNYMNFCDQRVEITLSCYNYQFDSIDENVIANLEISKKIELIYSTYIVSQYILRKIYAVIYHFSAILKTTDNKNNSQSLYNPVGHMQVFSVIDQMSKDILQTKGGNLFFAHLLFPHQPYIWTETCEVKMPIYSWRPYYDNHPDLYDRKPSIISTQKRTDYYKEYFKQIKCSMHKLDELFTRLREAGQYNDSIIIVHSDHGSRLYTNEPVFMEGHTITSQDYADSFSSLFAIKLPNSSQLYIKEPYPINKALHKYMGKPEESDQDHNADVFLEVIGDRSERLHKKKWHRKQMPNFINE